MKDAQPNRQSFATAEPQETVVLILSQRRLRHKFRTVFYLDTAYRLVGCAAHLNEAFSLVEENRPTYVLIEAPLTQSAEFQVMRHSFRSLNVTWLIVSEQSDQNTQDWSDPVLRITEQTSPSQIFSKLNALKRCESLQLKGREHSALDPAAPTPIVLIGASTGGIEALIKIVGGFSETCPPTIIVQHTTPGYGNTLAALLNKQSKAEVHGPKTAGPLRPGLVICAAGLPGHVVLKETPPKVVVTQKAENDPHAPSIDRLFQSAVPYAPRIVAALLTGMGRDGVEGLLELRKNGARTVAQDGRTSVVDGMPRAARETGAAARVVPIDMMSATLLAECEQLSRVRGSHHA